MAVFVYLGKGVKGFCAYCYKRNLFIRLNEGRQIKIFFSIELKITLPPLAPLPNTIQMQIYQGFELGKGLGKSCIQPLPYDRFISQGG